MKIINNGSEQEVKLLTYFKIQNNENLDTEYVLYTDSISNDGKIYISNVLHEADNISLVKPAPDALETLKKIIQNLISNNPNSFIFIQNKYKYIEVEKLDNVVINKIDCQKIMLNQDQYNNLLASDFLTYPYSNLTNIKKPDGFFGKNCALVDTISIVVSIILLLLIVGGLVAYQFNVDNLVNGVFNIDNILIRLATFDLYINNYLILQLAIVSLIFTVISFNSDKNHPILFWIFGTMIIMLIYVLWVKVNGYNYFSYNYFNFIKKIFIYSVFISLIFTICYSLCKEVTYFITNKLSMCNFISYYTIYFLLFSILFMGLGLFYHTYLFEYVQKIVDVII